MKKIIYTRPDGGVTVLTPAEGCRLARRITLAGGAIMVFQDEIMVYDSEDSLQAGIKTLGALQPRPVDSFMRRWPVAGAVAEWAETEAEWVDRLRLKDVPADATDVQIVDADKIPADRTFRAAWRADPVDAVAVDMTAAAEIHKETLRTLRAPKLAALDVDYLRALEAGDTDRMTAIAAEKAALRDVTKDPAIAAAATPDDLKAVIPEALR